MSMIKMSIAASSNSVSERPPEVVPAAGDSDGSHMFVFTNEKAGMKNVDKERANRIIHEMSKNSSFYKQAEQQDKKVDVKVEQMKEKLRTLDEATKALLGRKADRIVAELEAQRELDAVCMVVDMDMFYAAVEIRDRPDLADKPVAVGGNSMISTTNYIARKRGVRSAMPGFIGKRLCPELVFVEPDFEKYTRVSEQIRAIFRDYDPRMRSFSLDEAYLNITDAVLRRLNDPKDCPSGDIAGASEAALLASAGRGGDGVGVGFDEGDDDQDASQGEEDVNGGMNVDESGGGSAQAMNKGKGRRKRMFDIGCELAEEIRRRIRESTKLTASIGIGPNFMLAKIASDWKKPNGQYCVRGKRADVLRFLHDLPVRKVGGVGKVMEKCLREALGVRTCGELFRERALCMHVMTPHSSRWLLEVSLGIGSSDHDSAAERAASVGAITRKQISKERTFGELNRPQDLLAKCREICECLAAEMATKGLEAKTVGLKIKTTKFEVRTQDYTGKVYVSTTEELYSITSSLLMGEIRKAAASCSAPGGVLRLRLMGVKASSFRGQADTALVKGQGTLDEFFAQEPDSGSVPARVHEGAVEDREMDTKDAWGAEMMESRATSRPATSATLSGVSEEKLADRRVTSDDSPSCARGAPLEVRRYFSRNPEIADVGRRPTNEGAASRETSPAAASPLRSSQATPSKKRNLRDSLISSSSLGDSRGGHRATSRTAALTVASAQCPVCGRSLGAVTNAALNDHIDICLGLAPSVQGCEGVDRSGIGVHDRPASSSADEDRSNPRAAGPEGLLPAVRGKRSRSGRSGIERFLLPRE